MAFGLRILITGAEGFLGSNLAPKLAEDHEIIALDYLTNRNKSNLPREISYINHDLSKFNIAHMTDTNLVIHLAAISIERVSERPMYELINTASMLNILEFCRKKDADLILSSSCSVYGNGLNFKESDPFNPMSLYSVGKINEEAYAKYHHETYGLDVTILRYSNCYGDLTHIENKFYPGKKDVIRMFMEQALRGESLTVIEGQSRDFTFIDDVVDATRSVIGLKGFNIFNVATGIETQVEKLPNLILKTLSKCIAVKIIPPREIDNLKQRSLNIDKISHLWKPKHSLNEGLKLYAERLEEKN